MTMHSAATEGKQALTPQLDQRGIFGTPCLALLALWFFFLGLLLELQYSSTGYLAALVFA